MIIRNATYYGINDTAVNALLSNIGTWNQSAVDLLCKQARCDAALLQSALDGIEVGVNSANAYMISIEIAKLNTRKLIDCKFNGNSAKDELFAHYEDLDKRYVKMMNTHKNLNVKKRVLEKKIESCNNKSLIRKVLEALWWNYINNKTNYLPPYALLVSWNSICTTGRSLFYKKSTIIIQYIQYRQ